MPRIVRITKSSQEIDRIYKLGLETFKGEFWFTKKFLKETLNGPGSYYAAYEGTRLIGILLLKTYDPPKAWIYYFVVDKEHRRNGIGTKLLETAEKRLPKTHYLILVDFEETDKSAIGFYSALGFKEAARVDDWFGNGTQALLYSKKVKKAVKR